jgi:hypothetical protein
MTHPVPLPRRNRAAAADLAACSLSGRRQAECRARTGDLLQITKRCSSGRHDDACVTAGQTAIVRWILPLRMPLTGPTLTGFGFEFYL